jgi:predicted Zn-dependent protease
VEDPRVGPNAFQTIGRDGRPLIVFTSALLREAGSRDEVAFVLAHEAGHQIADHLTRVQRDQMLGALILGGLAAATGTATEQGMADAMDLGAFLGSRAYSQSYELEADVLGAYIAARAGYDPERGAQLFLRPALRNSGGPMLWSTHPPSAQRAQVVAETVREIRRQQAAGLEPSPANAERRAGL